MVFLSQHPEVVSILIVVVGFFVAAIVSRWTLRGFQASEGILHRLSPVRTARLSTENTHTLVERVAYYVILAFFLLLALRVLSEGGLSRWLDELLSYVPQLIVGGIIIVIGWLLGVMTHSLVTSVMQPGQTQLLPRLAQIIVVVTAVVTGLDQMDINISFIANIVVILIGTFVGGMALSFAIGSRQLVANLLGRRDLDRYRVGDRIRINDIEGTVMELGSTAVVMETRDGMVTVPAARFSETEVTRLHDSQGDAGADA